MTSVLDVEADGDLDVEADGDLDVEADGDLDLGSVRCLW